MKGHLAVICCLPHARERVAAPAEALDVDTLYEAMWAERDRLNVVNEVLYRRAARAILAHLTKSVTSPADMGDVT